MNTTITFEFWGVGRVDRTLQKCREWGPIMLDAIDFGVVDE
jgi:hypothetical protein